MILEGLVVFAGALLLFLVEPLIARMLLPLFGGTAAVWLTSLLFFQAALLAGYWLAHLCAHRAWGKRALFALLAIACVALPVRVAPGLLAGAPPIVRLLALLAQSVGLPFLALSVTGPTAQAIQARRGSEPWRLYALSNAASAIGLLLYPAVLEPLLALRAQAVVFSIAFVAFAIGFATVLFRAPAFSAGEATATGQLSPLVFLLPACSSSLLLAITASITQNLAPVPLLWLLPLALYLASFVVAFELPRAYHRGVAAIVVPIALFGLAWQEARVVSTRSLPWTIAGVLLAFFVCSTALHAELARARPHPSLLTRYYLRIAAGSVGGSLFVAVIAPLAFDRLLELPVSIVACAALIGAAWAPLQMSRVARIALNLVPAALAVLLVWRMNERKGATVLRARNFYGAIAVRDEDADEDGVVRIMVNGTINHGAQAWTWTPREPTRDSTTYYTESSGVGRAIGMLHAERPGLRIGVIGLGAGVLAAYCRPEDAFVFYEINPLVEKIAREQFTFLAGCPHAEVHLGDARLVLTGEAPHAFDLLVVDAFSSDSIPVHLLTREAFDLYKTHLAPGGILAVHVSNRSLDLTPVVAAHADRLGWPVVGVEDEGEDDDLATPSAWILLAPRHPLDKLDGTRLNAGRRQPWTDDFSNLITLLRR